MIFLKFFLWIIHFGGDISESLLKKLSKFSFLLLLGIFKVSERKWEITKSAVYHKRCVQMDHLLRLIITTTINFNQFWRISSTSDTKVYDYNYSLTNNVNITLSQGFMWSIKCRHRSPVLHIHFCILFDISKWQLGAPTHNYFHNILRIFNVLPNYPFTTSEMMRDYYL